MICEKCGALNPDGMLACEGCVRRACEIEQEKYQRMHLERVRAGRGVLFSVTKHGDQHIHARMAGVPITYCGKETRLRGWEIGKLLWAGVDAIHFCPACRMTINRIMARPVEAA